MPDVLIVGAGPTGLTAAAEAVRHGLSVRIVDVNASRSIHSKALVLHSRSLEIFADMGCVDAVLQSGQEFRALNIHADGNVGTRIDFRTLDWQDAIYPFWLSLPQSDTERLLEDHLARLGVRVERRTQLTAVSQEADRVQATLRQTNDLGALVSEEVIEVSWLIGCDGAGSTTRKLCQIPFEGTSDDEVFILADVKIEWAAPHDEGHNFMSSDGIVLVVPMPRECHRIIAHMPALVTGQAPEITQDLLQLLMDQRTSVTSRIHDLAWSSSFSVKHLMAANHRKGRIFLAGDAAHIHSPVGGQGLNTGIQDAYNLVWKLALVHKGKAGEQLLNSYAAERHEVAEATIKRVSFATKMVTLRNPISRMLRNHLAAVLGNTATIQNRMGRDVGMLNINYRNSPVVSEDAAQITRVLQFKQAFRASIPGFHNGPRSGDRAPNILFADEKGAAHSLVDYFYGTQHTLLLFAGLSDCVPSAMLQQIHSQVAQCHASTINCYIVTTTAPPSAAWKSPIPVKMIVNPNGAIHRRYGVTVEALYLIRPDNHIGYRSQPVRPELFVAYLEQILSRHSKGSHHVNLGKG